MVLIRPALKAFPSTRDFMSLDINPVVPQGRQQIQSYGDKRFRISAEVFKGSVIVFPEETQTWSVTDLSELGIDALAPVTRQADDIDILLIGCGPRFCAVPRDLRADIKAVGMVLEWMDTGAACRTFNVLVAEERRVCAALIAVD
mgnify:CR=1 FL=1